MTTRYDTVMTTETPRRTIRLDPGRWAKLKRLGMSWLKRQIDRAKESKEAPEAR